MHSFSLESCRLYFRSHHLKPSLTILQDSLFYFNTNRKISIFIPWTKINPEDMPSIVCCLYSHPIVLVGVSGVCLCLNKIAVYQPCNTHITDILAVWVFGASGRCDLNPYCSETHTPQPCPEKVHLITILRSSSQNYLHFQIDTLCFLFILFGF